MKKCFICLILVMVLFLINMNSIVAVSTIIEGNFELYQIQDKDKAELAIKNVFNIYKEDLLKKSNIKKMKKNEKELEEEPIENIEVVEQEVQTVQAVEEYYVIDANLPLHENIVNFALQFVGYPYVMGGNSLTNGTDCSGFVQLVYGNFGISLPRTTYEQSISGYGISVDQIVPGDIVSYGYDGYATHSALYIGNGQIIHAATPDLGIRIDNLYMMPIVAIRRIA